MDSVAKRVLRVVALEFTSDEKDIPLNSSFVDDLGADSLDLVELILAFEEEFDIEISDDDAEKISTVQNAVDYINNLTE